LVTINACGVDVISAGACQVPNYAFEIYFKK
jgi:hypothetical protein